MARKWPKENREIALSFVVFLGLALPFMPVPGDGLTRMDVHFHTSGMARPHAFTAQTKRSICQVLAATLAFESPETGEYTRITCAE